MQKTLSGTIYRGDELIKLDKEKNNFFLKILKKIEYEAYKEVSYMRQMQYYHNLLDIIEDYVESTPENTYIWISDAEEAYIIYKVDGDTIEGVDIASTNHMAIAKRDLLSILRAGRGKMVEFSLRDKTSYPIFQNILKRYPDEFELISDEIDSWGSEEMHEMKIYIKPITTSENYCKNYYNIYKNILIQEHRYDELSFQKYNKSFEELTPEQQKSLSQQHRSSEEYHKKLMSKFVQAEGYDIQPFTKEDLKDKKLKQQMRQIEENNFDIEYVDVSHSDLSSNTLIGFKVFHNSELKGYIYGREIHNDELQIMGVPEIINNININSKLNDDPLIQLIMQIKDKMDTEEDEDVLNLLKDHLSNTKIFYTSNLVMEKDARKMVPYLLIKYLEAVRQNKYSYVTMNTLIDSQKLLLTDDKKDVKDILKYVGINFIASLEGDEDNDMIIILKI